jgi:hypothetical protein
MRLFLKKIFLFSIFIILLVIFLDYVITESLQKSRRFNFSEWNDIFNGNVKANTVIYGSSRAWVHFDPKIMEDKLHVPFYNLGLDGYQFHMQYARHLLYFKNNPVPKNIILSIDYWTLGKTSDLYMTEQFLPYIHDSVIREYTQSYNGLSYFDYNLPFVRYFGRSKYVFHALDIIFNDKNNYSLKYKGFMGQDKKWDQNLSQAVLNISKNKNISKTGDVNSLDFTLDQETLDLFDQFLIEMKNKNVNIFLVISPIYIGGQKYVNGHNDFIKKFDSIAIKNNISFLDYTNDKICYDSTMFYNATHLNKEGAKLFSEKLANDLKKYY